MAQNQRYFRVLEKAGENGRRDLLPLITASPGDADTISETNGERSVP